MTDRNINKNKGNKMNKDKLKTMSFEEANNINTIYTRIDSTGTQVEDSFTQEEIKTKLNLNTMQINDFLNALEHKIDSMNFDKKTNKDEYMFKVGLKMGLENALHLCIIKINI